MPSSVLDTLDSTIYLMGLRTVSIAVIVRDSI